MSDPPPDERPEWVRWQDGAGPSTEARRTHLYLAAAGGALALLALWFLLEGERGAAGFVLVLAIIFFFTSAALQQGSRRPTVPRAPSPTDPGPALDLVEPPPVPPPAPPSPALDGFGDHHVDLPFGGGEAGNQVAAELLGLEAEPPGPSPHPAPTDDRPDEAGGTTDA